MSNLCHLDSCHFVVKLVLGVDIVPTKFNVEPNFQDGYFVHFFAPQNLKSLPKHIVFVLDISGSMEGEKIQQMKDAMVTILDDLNEEDHFNIVTFSSEVENWNPKSSTESKSSPLRTFLSFLGT